MRTSLPPAASRRALERRLDAVGDEVERRAALHLDRRARVVGEHEDRARGRADCRPTSPSRSSSGQAPRTGPNMLRPRIQAPTFSKPRAAKSSSIAGRAAVLAEHLLEGAGRDEPVVQRLAADAERILEALVRPGAVAVERDRECVNTDFAHARKLDGFLERASARDLESKVIDDPHCVTVRRRPAARLSHRDRGGAGAGVVPRAR